MQKMKLIVPAEQQRKGGRTHDHLGNMVLIDGWKIIDSHTLPDDEGTVWTLERGPS